MNSSLCKHCEARLSIVAMASVWSSSILVGKVCTESRRTRLLYSILDTAEFSIKIFQYCLLSVPTRLFMCMRW